MVLAVLESGKDGYRGVVGYENSRTQKVISDQRKQDVHQIKDKTKVACRMSGIERRVVYFRKLLFETNNEKQSQKSELFL